MFWWNTQACVQGGVRLGWTQPLVVMGAPRWGLNSRIVLLSTPLWGDFGALETLPEQAWRRAVDADGQPRDRAHVAEVTAWLPTTFTGPGG